MSKAKNKRKFLAVSVAAAVAGSVVTPAAVGAQTNQLIDIEHLKASQTDGFYDAVTTLAGKGVIKGFEDGTFRPYANVTRGQAAAIIARLFGLDKQVSPNPGFMDVPDSYRFYKEIAALRAAKIIDGVTKDSFKPEAPIKRSEMAKMIANAFALQENKAAAKKFADVRAGSWYEGYVGALIESGITQGRTATTFDPDSYVTRVQFAAFIYRADQIEAKEPVKPEIPENNEKPGDMENPGANEKPGENKNPAHDENAGDNQNPGDNESQNENQTETQNPGEEKKPGSANVPSAPTISFVGDNLVGNVVDLLNLSEDVPVRFTIANTGVKAGDKLLYSITSDSGSKDFEVTIKQSDIARGYVETEISTDALRNVLGTLLNLDGLLSGVTGSSVSAAAANDDVAATTITLNDPEVEAAGLLDWLLFDVLGLDAILGSLGGENGILGSVLKDTLSGVLSKNSAVNKLLQGDDLLGVDLGNGLTGVIGLIEGVVLEVVDGVITGVLPGNENGKLGVVSLLDDVLKGVPIIGGEDGLVSGLLDSVLGGSTVGTLLESVLSNPTDALDLIFTSTNFIDELIGLDLLGNLTGEVELLDGLLAIVKEGKILNIVPAAVDGVLKGAEEITITVKLKNEAGESKAVSKTYRFQIKDLLKLSL